MKATKKQAMALLLLAALAVSPMKAHADGPHDDDKECSERLNDEAKKKKKDLFSVEMDTTGFHPTVNISEGMGIDLSDGSLRIDLGGGFVLDSDDGIGFKFW